MRNFILPMTFLAGPAGTMPRPPNSTKNLRVVVVRHGPAENRDARRWPNDARRPLTARGRIETRQAAAGLAELTSRADRLASSAATRAIATAELVQRAIAKGAPIETWPELAPGILPGPVFAKLRRASTDAREVVLVGHDPTLSEFVSMAILGDGVQAVRISKGGAACLEFPTEVKPGAGRLVWLLTRRQLAARRRRSAGAFPSRPP